ncbi:MAG: transglutaminase family protein, partial [Rhodospirillaceae bacterium]
MSIKVALRHRTAYSYPRLTALGPQVIRLRPAPHCRTPILAYSLKVEPAAHFLNWQQDPQGNFLARVVVPERTKMFSVTIDLIADMAIINPFDFFLEPAAETFPFAYDSGLDEELAPFRKRAAAGPMLQKYINLVRPAPGRTIDALIGLNRKLREDIDYIVRLESGVQTPEETLSLRKGSCRDSSWLLVHILRHLGFAARFVSGYLIQLVPDQKPLDGPAGVAADFTDLHAWCEVYLPGAGWIGLDPTSGLLTGEGHIPLAASPEPQSAAAISGLSEKTETKFSFEMDVQRLPEAPRITHPYSDDAWTAVNALGQRIDGDLARLDVRLTMGGEPTFVAADDPDGDEWNTAALGPTKRRYAGALIRRLAGRFAAGYLLHYGQGKWYPGEQLPRWALTCLWRKDGKPVWRDVKLLAADDDRKPALTIDDARGFALDLAARLGVDPTFAVPAHEDLWYYLWRERQLPVNVDPLKSELKDPLERARFARLFDQGLEKVVGFALPIEALADKGSRGWRSGPWVLRREAMYLLPGDSPMGYRLPLDSLPWVTPKDYPYPAPPDPMAAQAPLPPAPSAARPLRMQDPRAAKAPATAPEKGKSDSSVVRTALCVEVRDGLLHIFMPPLDSSEDYLDLAAAVEDVAAARRQQVVLEGYLPPSDARLQKFSVTPDPGVIEVNIHPSASWTDLASATSIVYEEARAERLIAEKFMLDGRHVGTGGGNHIVLGGPTPADSPLLRRPDLVKSLVGYWHNHPSLSYLFSGLFIGPTSQHPRVDEARDDSTYELELAFQALARAPSTPPWLVDRVFRDVLVDVTGNTHRTEFCVDKLYSPDGATGRLGLLELRAFEMPPHPRMSLAQQLLLRALVAHFWQTPYDQPLARYGTRLHDEFMLPYFCGIDFSDVL